MTTAVKWRVPAAALILTLLLGCRSTARGGVSPAKGVPILMGVIESTESSGVLEYWGSCKGFGPSPDFPRLRAPSASTGSAVELLREAFADDPKMRVTQEPGAATHMVETDVPHLLDVRISHISFGGIDGPAAYRPSEAKWSILTSPEVQAFLKSHNIGIEPPFEQVNIVGQGPPTGPHVSGGLDNVSVSEAFDYVLRTFPGLWTIEYCPSARYKSAVAFTFYQRYPIRARKDGD